MARNKNAIRNGSLFWDVVIYTFLGLLAIVFLYPLYQVFVCSISDPSTVMTKNSLVLFPVGVHWGAYEIVFNNPFILSGFKNTLLYMAIGTSLSFFMTLILAYPLSIPNLTGKKAVIIFFTIPMYFGGGLIPFYLLLTKMKMLNTIWVLTIPGCVSFWNSVIMRTQFNSIPAGLREAAVIDGAGDGTILFRIMLPLSGAVSAVLILFSVVGFWNMWFEPMLYLTKRNMYPIQSVLREILIEETSTLTQGANRNGQVKLLRDNPDMRAVNQLIKYSTIIVTTVPILCVYPFAQRYFVKGVMIGSLKG